MEHFQIIFNPDGRRISIHAGATLLEAAGQAGIILNTVCGGKGTCGKCAVVLDHDARQVLACQHRIRSDLAVTIPPASRLYEHKILEEGPAVAGHLRLNVYRRYTGEASGPVLFGAAVDIGTTTIVARLLDLTDGRTIATESALNPQTAHGDDVISRIAYAESDAKLAALHKLVIQCVNRLLARLCRGASIDPEDIYEISAVGNTTMNHLLLKLPVAQLGHAPYAAHSLDARDLPPEEIGLYMNPAGNVHTVENIAGFVGADTLAAALAVNIEAADGMTLLVDIGTNGELVLGTKDRLYAASCAAGPALEGARIQCGGRAAEGAIEAVVADEADIDIDVIGSGPARSICGSGLIDAVAVMLDLGVIDATGRFAEPESLRETLPPAIFARLIERKGQPAFLLARSGDEGTGEVFLTQKDIREMQLAKAAIAAGAKLLLKNLALQAGDIRHILLAGAFGNYIRRESALRVGLLPDVPPERIRFVGNAALAGAQMTLLSHAARARAKRLARKIQYIEIAHEKDFQDTFADSILF